MKTITLSSGETLSFLGPTLDVGPLPALLYFTMSHRDSLLQSPYNQALIPLQGAPIRIFSWDLPYHPVGIEPDKGIQAWQAAHERGEDFLTPFIDSAVRSLQELEEKGVIIPRAVIAAGLSRGAFIAFNMAAASDVIGGVLAFAPLVEFHGLSLDAVIPKLASKWVRGSIGFHDERVHTDKVIRFFSQLVEEAKKQRVPAPNIQLNLYPSIGLKGHGTPEDVFIAGGQSVLKRISS